MPLVTTKIRGISHLTTGCLRLIHVRYGALNGLKSEIEKCPKSGTRPALDIDEAQCLRSVKLRNTQQAQSSAVPPRTGRQRGLRPRTLSGSKVMEFGEASIRFADPLLWNVVSQSL
jgi:hypothetical protein